MELIGLESEMNRGFLQLLVLIVLSEPMYGYMMIRKLEDMKFLIEENTLYPLLRRLESKNYIESKWEVGDGKPKKFYVITNEGKEVRRKLLRIWNEQNEILNKCLEGFDNV